MKTLVLLVMTERLTPRVRNLVKWLHLSLQPITIVNFSSNNSDKQSMFEHPPPATKNLLMRNKNSSNRIRSAGPITRSVECLERHSSTHYSYHNISFVLLVLHSQKECIKDSKNHHSDSRGVLFTSLASLPSISVLRSLSVCKEINQNELKPEANSK